MDNEKQKAAILEYLESSYSGAKMMDDIEIQTRVGRAIEAFKADVHEDIFREGFIESQIEREVQDRLEDL